MALQSVYGQQRVNIKQIEPRLGPLVRLNHALNVRLLLAMMLLLLLLVFKFESAYFVRNATLSIG